MAWSDDLRTRYAADGALVAILTGGIYAQGASPQGREGINRTDPAFAGAFAPNGILRPCAWITAREAVVDGGLRDDDRQVVSMQQTVMVFLYEAVNYASIDAAAARIFTLSQGLPLSGTLALELVLELPRERDSGALMGSALYRMDFLIRWVKGA